MKILITGGCGFLGSNIAVEALERGHDVILFDNYHRVGSHANLDWIKFHGKPTFIHGDIRNQHDVENCVTKLELDAVFHLAGQVAMTTSIINPRLDFEINALGTLNLLESLRCYSPSTKLVYSSTNKVYGDLEQFTYQENSKRYTCADHPKGFDEKLPLDFHSPYGCSKGTADQYILDYCRIFGLQGIVLRHSSMYGGRQFATEDQGWVGWFCQKAIEAELGLTVKPFTISGNGKQVRDVLHASDIRSLYFNALDNMEIGAGHAFNIGGGIDNSLSLLELFSLLETTTKTQLEFTKLPARESDQKFFVADICKAEKILKWVPKINARDGIEMALEWARFCIKKN